MSVIDEKMKPKEHPSSLKDEVAKTLGLFADTRPLTPTKTSMEMEWNPSRDSKTYSPKDEKDISMLTNISGNIVYLSALNKAFAQAYPCEARQAFMEQILRACRSKDGWGLKITVEALKAVRPQAEEEVQHGRFRRFMDFLSGKKR